MLYNMFLMVTMLTGDSADACSMRPPELQIGKLQQNSAIIAATIDEKRGRSSALLNDGRLLRVMAMGCHHSGMSASLWVDGVWTEPTQWLEAAEEASQLAFPDDVHRQLARALMEQAYVLETRTDGLAAHLSTGEDLSIDVEMTRLGMGALVTVTYVTR